MIRLVKEHNGVPCHQYIDDDKPWMEYTSVSKVKAYCKQPVDAGELAAKCIHNINSPWFGKDYESVLRTWDNIRINGLNNGTKIHKIIEAYLADDNYFGATEFEQNIIERFETKISALNLNETSSILTEYPVSVDICNKVLGVTAKQIEEEDLLGLVNLLLIVKVDDTPNRDTLMSWSRGDIVSLAKKLILRQGLAGTIDIIKNYDDNSFGIVDIKTDKKIRMKGFYIWKDGSRKFKMMKPPLHHLHDCNWVEYCLQVSLYALMYAKETGRRYRGTEILHWRKNDDVPDFNIIKADRLTKYTGKLLNHYFGISYQNLPQSG